MDQRKARDSHYFFPVVSKMIFSQVMTAKLVGTNLVSTYENFGHGPTADPIGLINANLYMDKFAKVRGSLQRQRECVKQGIAEYFIK